MRYLRANVCVALAVLYALSPPVYGQQAGDTDAPKPAVAQARLLETARLKLLREKLDAAQIAFEERPLLSEYGFFGSNIRVHLPAADGVQREDKAPRFVLAVPVLSPSEAAGEAAASALSFAQEAAAAFIKKIYQEPPAGFRFDADVYFLADIWAGNNPGSPAGDFAAWQDMLEEGGETVVLYMDMGGAPERAGIYSGGRKGRTPFEYIQKTVKLLEKNKIPFFFDYDENTYLRLTAENGLLDLNNGTPALFITAFQNNGAGHGTADFGTREQGGGGLKSAITLNDMAGFIYSCALETAAYRDGIYSGADDKNYLAFFCFGKVFLLNEKTLVIPALCLFTALFNIIFFIYIKTRKIKALVSGIFLSALFLFILFFKPPPPSLRTSSYIPEPAEFEEIPAEGALSLDVSAKPFLRRSSVSLKIASAKTPLRFRLLLDGISSTGAYENFAPFIYESPLPLRRDGERIEFLSGNYPPNPLELEIALPEGITGAFSVEAYWTDGSRAAISSKP